MRYFVTGASGWIGSAVVAELLTAGHQVTGLARSDESAAKIAAAGAEVVRGSLHDLELLRAAASDSDGVAHTAYMHELAFTGRIDDAAAADIAALEAFGDALAGSDRPLVIASAIALRNPGAILLESETPDAGSPNPRTRAEELALGLADRGVRASAIRTAPTVHGSGDTGFIATLTQIARERGVAGYVDDGSNRWPAVHVSDAARLYRLALEQAPAGSALHAVQEEGVPAREIAQAIAAGIGVETVSIPQAEADAHFGWIAPFFAGDMPASSAHTRALLGWEPTGPTLLEDLEAGHYFAG